MSVIVGPEFEKKTHHVSLSDGTYTVGLMVVNTKGEADPSAIGRAAVPRTALKTTSGDQKYSDYEPPWSPVSQDDFTGGMGLLDDSDTTRYRDGFRCNTAYSGGFFLGPQETYATGLRSEDRHLPGSVTWTMLGGGRTYMAVSFTASANYSATAIAILLRRVGTPTTDVTIELCANSAGNPGAVYASATVSTTDITDVISRFYHAAVTAYGITSGTVYWIKVYSTGGDTDNHWEVGVENASGSSKQSSDGTTWTSSSVDLYYR
ncbi:MAG: hypothetical protein GYA59_12580, partial [Chloroflexi bacterium]|nr:hypothetical protein [Chloroflexota bacterium]